MTASSRCGALLSVLLLTPIPIGAQDNPDAQTWVQFVAVGDVAGWRSHIEVQPRFMENVSQLGLTLVRTAVGRRLSPSVTMWIGHAWVPRSLGSTTRHEQRVWQQLQAALPSRGGWTPSVRLRVEQRWLDPWEGASHRVRVLSRAQRSFGTTKAWGAFAYDEIMVTVDRTPRGPSPGYDRNRVSAGFVRRLSPTLSTDVGYVWEHAAAAGGRRNDHVAIAVLNLSAPR